WADRLELSRAVPDAGRVPAEKQPPPAHVGSTPAIHGGHDCRAKTEGSRIFRRILQRASHRSFLGHLPRFCLRVEPALGGLQWQRLTTSPTSDRALSGATKRTSSSDATARRVICAPSSSPIRSFSSTRLPARASLRCSMQA